MVDFAFSNHSGGNGPKSFRVGSRMSALKYCWMEYVLAPFIQLAIFTRSSMLCSLGWTVVRNSWSMPESMIVLMLLSIRSVSIFVPHASSYLSLDDLTSMEMASIRWFLMRNSMRVGFVPFVSSFTLKPRDFISNMKAASSMPWMVGSPPLKTTADSFPILSFSHSKNSDSGMSGSLLWSGSIISWL